MMGASQHALGLALRKFTPYCAKSAVADAMRGETERTLWRLQIEQLNANVQELQTKSWQDSNCRGELDVLKST